MSTYFPNATVLQVSSTFLAGLVWHVSTQTLWTHRGNGMIPILCPSKGSLLAWDSDPDKRKKKKEIKTIKLKMKW